MGGESQQRTAASSYPKMAVRPVGKQIHNIYKDRLGMFASEGQYESQSLLSKLYEGIASGEPAIKLSVWSAPYLSRPSFKDATSSKNTFRSAHIGDSFGPSWSTHWFKVEMTVPKELCDKDHLELHWDANNEGMVWTEHGDPLQGLTGNNERIEWVLPESFRDGKKHLFYIEMACNGMFGNAPGGDANQPPSPDKTFQLARAEIVAVNLEARGLKIDFWIIGDAAREFPEDSWEEHEALQVCNRIMDHFIAEKGSQNSILKGREIAQEYIGNVNSSKVYDNDNEVVVSGIGHCHIDTCWLWPWAETKRKVARSWLNQCGLMDRYPEHRFCASQAQQYKWLKTYYPSAFDRVKSKVKTGQFHPIGGSWVEHDTNMPSGESLVRQFLYGQRFFESHFGERSTTFWLPDTFGYSSQLPQLCRMAGMSRFFTQKLSWNNINTFPHTTFNWVALDGSQVLCHMCPSNTYTADAHFGDVSRSVTQHKSLDQDKTSLLVFGKGDGGGGPTWEMLEKLRRCRGISDKVGRLPRVKMGSSVDDFFVQLEKKAANGTDFVTWYGELYFELHRGTYTTQSNNKRNNRRGEIMLHDIEFLATMASLKDVVEAKGSQYKYPKKEIDEMWENVLLCQFHDCLPGSSIEMCYDDTEELYAKTFAIGEKLLADAISALGFKSVSSEEGEIVAINTMPFARSGLVDLQQLHLPSPFGMLGGGIGVSTIIPVTSAKTGTVSVKKTEQDVYVLENSAVDITITSGVITSFFDKKASRQVLAPNAKANQLTLYDDKPLYWQAWDVEVYHLASRQALPVSSTVINEHGPHRASITTHTVISDKSWIKTTTSLSADSAQVDFSSTCEWHEDKSFLKVEFPVDVRNTSASYETQFGLVTRPTHYNTSWDMAKFEVCTHKWADLSESSYGVSILNDGKYGFATQGNVMRLSLLRAPKAPDGHADMGPHAMRWSMLPHSGPLGPATIQAGFAFNNPVAVPASHDSGALFPHTEFSSYVRTAPAGCAGLSLLSALRLSADSAPAIVLDTIKRGEDDADVRYAGDADGLRVREGRSVIVRFYDSMGGQCRGFLEFGNLPVRKVTRCNLLEDEEGEVVIEERAGRKGVPVMLKVFEVASFMLQL